MAKHKYSSRPNRKGRRDRYANESRAEENRVKKLESHLKKFPNDKQAKEALSRPRPKKNKPNSSLYPKVYIREVQSKDSKERRTIVSRLSREMVQIISKLRKAMNANGAKNVGKDLSSKPKKKAKKEKFNGNVKFKDLPITQLS